MSVPEKANLGTVPTSKTPAELNFIEPATVAPNNEKLPDNVAEALSVLLFAGIESDKVGAVNLMSPVVENTRSPNVAEKVNPAVVRLPVTLAVFKPLMPRSKPSVPVTLKVGTHVAPTAQVSAAVALTLLTERPETGFHGPAVDKARFSTVPVALRTNEPLAVPKLKASPPLTGNEVPVAPTVMATLKSVADL